MIRTLTVLILVIFSMATPGIADSEKLNGTQYQYAIDIPYGGLPEFFRWHPARMPLVSHHRGGPVPGYPENAIETMEHALTYGPGLMEVDVARLSDGTLVLMHDATLDRTTTGTGPVAHHDWSYVRGLYLKDETGTVTPFRVPLLRDVLKWAKSRAILTLDIKRGVSFKKVAALVKETGTGDYTIAIAYNIRQAQAFHELAPFMPLTISMKDEGDITDVRNSGIPKNLVIAWTGTTVRETAFYERLHQEGWCVIMGTLGPEGQSLDSRMAEAGNTEGYMALYRHGIDIIATDRYQVVQREIMTHMIPPDAFLFVRTPRFLKQ